LHGFRSVFSRLPKILRHRDLMHQTAFIGRRGLKLFRRAALAALVAVVCGCGGNYNPTPAISSLFPPVITAGSQSFTLYIDGTNFQSNTTAQWDGVDRPVVYNDQTNQLTMPVLDTDVSNPGSGQLTVANPAPGGGLNQNAFSFVINPPSADGPVITSVSPSSAVVGSSSDITLTVSGTNLSSSDVISFNGTSLDTTPVGSPVTALTATVGSQHFNAASIASVAIQTNTPDVASPSVAFPIGPSSNPSPRLSTISPNSTKTGTVPPGEFLILNGSGFVPGSTVEFNGSPDLPNSSKPRPVSYSSSTQLIVSVISTDVASGGTVSVTVVNPSPGGGTSQAVNFTIQ
jgi:hypothetical protein